VKEKRFKIVYKEGSELTSGRRMILVDTETGVNYLLWKEDFGECITPLLDAEGKPIVTKADGDKKN